MRIRMELSYIFVYYKYILVLYLWWFMFLVESLKRIQVIRKRRSEMHIHQRFIWTFYTGHLILDNARLLMVINLNNEL